MGINWSLLALLRFVLAFIVACAHVIYFDRNPVALWISELGAKAAVVGFLLVSGFSIAASLDRNRDGFYFRRFKRIYPVYFVAVLWGIFLEYHYGAFDAPYYKLVPTGAISAVGSLVLVQTFLVKSIAFNPVIWSLAVECSFYVLAPFVLHREKLVMTLCAVSIVFYLLPDANHGLLYAAALKANAVKYFWPFGFGLLLYRIKNGLATGAVCAVLGSIVVFVSPINYEKYAIVTYLLSVGVVCAASRMTAESRWMDYLGDVSYPLYLVQFPTFITMFKVAGVTNAYALMLSVLIASIAIYEIVDLRIKPIIFAKRTGAAYAPSGP